MSTIKDVAARAQVGVGTVSRVINGSAAVSDATRARVMAAIDELGFRPSPAARALSSGRARTIAVTAPFLTRPSVVERVRGVIEALNDSDYDVQLSTVESPEQRQTWFARVRHRTSVAGALLISMSPSPDEIVTLKAVEGGVVLVDTVTDELPALGIDDVQGGVIAARHLRALGHRRIAYVGDAVDPRFHFTSSDNRLTGLTRVLEETGAPLDPAFVRLGEHCRDAAAALARELLQRPDRPTAIFAGSDTQAVGVLAAARECGLEVPRDLSVIGFDDIELAEIVGLTTVNQPLAESGRCGAQLLLDQMGESPGAARFLSLPLTLVERDTTAPAPLTET